MNTSKLQLLFDHYIRDFERINDDKNDETYKWAVVQGFQDGFDLQASDFAGMLYPVWRLSENLIDNARQLPFWALVEYARSDPETVREMFAALYQDDGGDLIQRQQKIDAFIAKSEELRSKYRPDSWRYVNDQRSVMTYLFLHDPDHNYLYKSTQAHEFADCVEFYDDWGSGVNFKLEVYYRMCDQLVAEMRANPALIKTNASRYEGDKRRLYCDDQLHILAFDMIYSSQVYGLYGGIDYGHLDSKEKRLYIERAEKANRLQAVYDECAKQQEHLVAVREYLHSVIVPGIIITHKLFGNGVVEASDGDYLVIRFDRSGELKRFGFLSALAGGYIVPTSSDINQYIMENVEIMKADSSIPAKLKSAEAVLAPYLEFLS